MSENIIVGHVGLAAFEKVFAYLFHENVILVNNFAKTEQLPFPKSEPIIYSRQEPVECPSVFKGSPFVCKGKHEYREVLTKEDNLTHSNWICQCERILGK